MSDLMFSRADYSDLPSLSNPLLRHQSSLKLPAEGRTEFSRSLGERKRVPLAFTSNLQSSPRTL